MYANLARNEEVHVFNAHSEWEVFFPRRPLFQVRKIFPAQFLGFLKWLSARKLVM